MDKKREKKLVKKIVRLNKPMKKIPFQVVIRGLYGTVVKKFDKKAEDNQETLKRITEAMRKACKAVPANPIKRTRPNEAGNDMKEFVLKALCEERLEAIPPRTKSGKVRFTGYPDIKIESTNVPIYLQVKTFADASYKTALRSFYLSPADDPKVTDDAHHLLVGFKMIRDGNLYFPATFEIVDLFGLGCDLKPEFNSNNNRLYENDRNLVCEQVDPTRSFD